MVKSVRPKSNLTIKNVEDGTEKHVNTHMVKRYFPRTEALTECNDPPEAQRATNTDRLPGRDAQTNEVVSSFYSIHVDSVTILNCTSKPQILTSNFCDESSNKQSAVYTMDSDDWHDKFSTASERVRNSRRMALVIYNPPSRQIDPYHDDSKQIQTSSNNDVDAIIRDHSFMLRILETRLDATTEKLEEVSNELRHVLSLLSSRQTSNVVFTSHDDNLRRHFNFVARYKKDAYTLTLLQQTNEVVYSSPLQCCRYSVGRSRLSTGTENRARNRLRSHQSRKTSL